MELGDCIPLHARISAEQCKRNSKGYRARGTEVPPHVSCQGCKGLVNLGPVALPKEEKKPMMHKVKTYNCSHKGCGRKVKKEGDSCWQHKGLEDQIEAGLTEGDKAPVQEEKATGEAATEATAHDICHDCKAWDACKDTTRPVGGCHAFAAKEPETAATSCDASIVDINDEEVASRSLCADCVSDSDCINSICPPSTTVSACTRYVAPAPPHELDTITADSFEPVEVVREEVKEWVRESLEELSEETRNGQVTGLQALLRMPPPPPPIPEGLLIPITLEESKELIAHGVTTEELAQLVRMLLAGKLCQLEAA